MAFKGSTSGGFIYAATITAVQTGANSTYSPSKLQLETYSATARNADQVVLLSDGSTRMGSSSHYVGVTAAGVFSFVGTADFQPPRTSAATEPAAVAGSLNVWRDSANNKVYLIYNDADESQKKIELV